MLRVAIPQIDEKQARLLERKPLVVIIYALAGVIAFQQGRDIYTAKEHREDLQAKDAIINAQAKELIGAYKDVKDTYKELNTIFQPNKYYEKGNRFNRESANTADDNSREQH